MPFIKKKQQKWVCLIRILKQNVGVSSQKRNNLFQKSFKIYLKKYTLINPQYLVSRFESSRVQMADEQKNLTPQKLINKKSSQIIKEISPTTAFDASPKLYNQVYPRQKSTNQANKKYSKHIFKQSKRKLAKNINLPKFICRSFLQKFYSYTKQMRKNVEGEEKMIMNEIKYFVENKRKNEMKKRNSLFSLRYLKEFFGIDTRSSSKNPFERSFMMRKILHGILSSESLKIMRSSIQLRLKQEYFIGLKLMGLRARNGTLICRGQIPKMKQEQQFPN